MTSLKHVQRSTVLLLTLAIALIGGAAFAHFQLNMNVRIFHVVHQDDGLDIYMRMPMPYLVADKIGPLAYDGLPEPAPYTVNRLEDGVLMHIVAAEKVIRNPEDLGRIAAADIVIRSAGTRLPLKVVNVRVHPNGQEPSFATLSEAAAALAGGPSFPPSASETYVGDTVVDIQLTVSTPNPVGDYLFSVLADPGLPGQEDTANLLLDYRNDAPRTYRSRGLVNTAIEVKDSVFAATATFVVEGIRHILAGLDHVLFVICMILGAATLQGLVARVTGFTLGHTFTLVMGFFGVAPQGAWFIPTVETLIALSIIFAAADAGLRQTQAGKANQRAVVITSLIGLLHGFGFSFMLQNILKVDAPNVWQSLLAFNIGVEIGQLMIVGFVWPLVLFLRSRPEPVWRLTRSITAIAASLIALFWVVERVGAIFA